MVDNDMMPTSQHDNNIDNDGGEVGEGNYGVETEYDNNASIYNQQQQQHQQYSEQRFDYNDSSNNYNNSNNDRQW